MSVKFHIHIPTLLDFALGAACVNITLNGRQPTIPYVLYLKSISAFADIYSRNRPSVLKWYHQCRVQNIEMKLDVWMRYTDLRTTLCMFDHVCVDHCQSLMSVCKIAFKDKINDDPDAVISFIHRSYHHYLVHPEIKDDIRILFNNMLLCSPCPSIRGVLLSSGAELTVDNGDDLLHAMIKNGMTSNVKQELLNGAQINPSDVYAAIESGDVELVNLVRTLGIVLNNLDVSLVGLDVLRLLLSKGVLKDGTKILVTGLRSLEVVKWLMHHDLIDWDTSLVPCIAAALMHGGEMGEIVRYLILDKHMTVPADLLMQIVVYDVKDLGLLELVMDAGADVNAIEPGVCSTVMQEAPALLRFWMDRGITADTVRMCMVGVGWNGLLSCMVATMPASVIDMMINHFNLDVNADRDYDGKTALHMASERNQYDVVCMLLEHGAKRDAVDKGGYTPYDITTSARVRQLLNKVKCR